MTDRAAPTLTGATGSWTARTAWTSPTAACASARSTPASRTEPASTTSGGVTGSETVRTDRTSSFVKSQIALGQSSFARMQVASASASDVTERPTVLTGPTSFSAQVLI